MRLVNFFVKRAIGSQTIKSTSKKVYIMGKVYSIKLTDGSRNRIKINENHLDITLHPPTKSNFEQYLSSWYRRQARAEFYRAVEFWLPEFERLNYDIPYPQLKLFVMRKAWGRCYYTKGVITINLRLYTMPKECIDYIILHELTHFVAHDHGPLFKGILDKIDPQWRIKEAMLRKLEGQMYVHKQSN